MPDQPPTEHYGALTGEQIEYLQVKGNEFARLHVVPMLGPRLEIGKATAFTDACALLTEAVLACYLPGSELANNKVFAEAYDALKPIIHSYLPR